MANKRLNDLPSETDPASTDVVAIDGATTRKTTRANLLKENLEAIRGITSAADKGIQFTGAGTAATYDLTAAGKALLDDADAAAQRTTLGLVIGTNVQAYDASLADVAGITFAQGDVLYHNGTNLVALGAGTSGSFLKTQGAGANPTWDSIPGGGDLLSTNNLSDVGSAATSRSNLHVGIKGHIYGLTFSTAGSSATFGIAAGEASDSTGTFLMTLASAYTKTTSAWAVGSGNGSLDTGSIANTTWYHVYLIKRTDTGVVDVLTSTSATSPTLPTNYTLSRRIGSMKTDGSAQWVKFIQDGDRFLWSSRTADVAATNPGTSAVTRTLSTPLGVRVLAHVAVAIVAAAQTDIAAGVLISDLSVADASPAGVGGLLTTLGFTGSAISNFQYGGTASVMTNTSSQVRSRLQISAAGTVLHIGTIGWDDRRGRDA